MVTAVNINEAQLWFDAGWTPTALAKKYGVSKQRMSQLVGPRVPNRPTAEQLATVPPPPPHGNRKYFP